jgi:outer membrane receptor protein involved in Fe transport
MKTVGKSGLEGTILRTAILSGLAVVAAAQSLLAETNSVLQTSKPLSEMSLEELVNVQVSAGTLAGSDRRRVPGSVTTISSSDIRESGARNLNELLEIYVPNLLYLRHSWEADHLGFRGIIGDTDNKYLLLVNGQVMNNYVHAGALSERDLGLLGDIQEIQVVRGPGSAVYGAGALIGVVDIKTFDGTTFEGTELTAQAGEMQEFYSAEIRSGFKLSDNVHLFLYGGVSDLVGANNTDSPYLMSLNGYTDNGLPITAGRRYPEPLPKDRQMYRGLPPLKFHAQLTSGEVSLWCRYTRGGEVQPYDQRWLIQEPYGFPDSPPNQLQLQEIGYQQISVGADYQHEISDRWKLAGRLGFSTDDYVRQEFDGLLDANREEIYEARLLGTWTPGPAHAVTLGVEYVHGEFGLPTLGYPGGRALSSLWAGVNPTPDEVSGYMPRWSTDTYSLLGEERWDIAPEWTLYSDMRIDKNDQTDFMYSPRAALVYMPTRDDTFKLILSQATKADIAEELELQHQTSGKMDDTETLRGAELSYSRILGPRWSVGANTFFNYFHIIGWDNASNQTQPVGDANIVGVELEAAYQSKAFQLGISQGYSQLVGFQNSVQGIEGQAITAEPYGYGHDLNHWSTYITKMHFAWQPVEKLRFSGSLRVFWGWPGFKDYTDYANSQGVDSEGDPLEFLRSPNYNPYDQIQARLNLGLNYEVNPHLAVGVHGYNLLGLFDGHLNDRFVMFSSSAQQDSVAVMFTASCKF